MRTGPIYQSPWLALSFWPTLEVHAHMHERIPGRTEGGHTNTGSFSNFETFNVIFVTHLAISEAVLDEAVAQLNLEVCLLISIWQKDY